VISDEKTAAALRKIAEGIYELADAAFEATPPVVARAIPEDELFPPSEYEVLPVQATPQTEPALSRCPKHDVAWTVKAAGTTISGKAYSAFWKCSEKDDQGARGYCERKPVKAWADAHPAR